MTVLQSLCHTDFQLKKLKLKWWVVNLAMFLDLNSDNSGAEHDADDFLRNRGE